MRRTISRGPGGLLRVLAVLLFAVTVSTPTMALAQGTASTGKTLTGAFDVGPGGCPEIPPRHLLATKDGRSQAAAALVDAADEVRAHWLQVEVQDPQVGEGQGG